MSATLDDTPQAAPKAPEEEEEAGAGQAERGGAWGIEVGDYFPEVGDNMAAVTWAHAVNTLELLEQALEDSEIMMLEADVLPGTLMKKKTKEEEEEEEEKKKEEEGERSDQAVLPIMAHPPSVESDLTIAMWLDKVIEANQNGKKKGIKLDFKKMEIVKESLQELVKRKDKITFPVWLNADILPGPGDAPAGKVPAAEFVSMCRDLCPQATLSLGWTTHIAPGSHEVTDGYGRQHVEAMLAALEGHTGPVTFPVRAALVPASLDALELLLESVPDSTITIWSSPNDPFDAGAIHTLLNILGPDAVYLDLPEPQMASYSKVAAEDLSHSASFNLLPTSASAWATVGMALASALAALYLYE